MSKNGVSAVVLRADGTTEQLPSMPTGDELRSFVGGFFETVTLRHEHLRATAFLNEDGKAKHLPHNERATHLLDESGGRPGDWVAGDVVVAGDVDDEGELLPLSADWLDVLVPAEQ